MLLTPACTAMAAVPPLLLRQPLACHPGPGCLGLVLHAQPASPVLASSCCCPWAGLLGTLGPDGEARGQARADSSLTVPFQGFVPAAIRLIPHTVLTFVFLEQLRKYFGIKVVT